jgi:AcrR family transcriptional regulator
VTEVSTTGRRIRGLNAEQRRAQRRDQLLDSALSLFAANGYQNTSIEQICATAYVSTKSFYEVFDGREDCSLELMRRSSERIIGQVVAAFEGQSGESEDELTATLVTAFAHAVVDDPRVAKVLFGEGVAVSAATERQRRTNRRWAAEFLQQVWRQYGHRDQSGRAVAVGVIGGLFDILADWLMDADTDDPAAIERLIADLLVFYRTVRAGL